jgi:hypothetical protein
MDEDLEMEDPNAEMLASKYGAGFAAGSPLAPFMSNLEGMRVGIAAEREAVAKRKKELFEAGEKEILARRYGAPTTREQLFALSAALASPRYYGGLAGTMSRVAPVLGEMSSLQSKAESQRSAALNQLRQQYEEGTLTSRLEGLESEADVYSKMLPSLVSATKPQGLGSWSETLQRYIPKDRAVVVASGKLPDGRRTEKMSDGVLRVSNRDGSYEYYDAGGNRINAGGQ